MNGVELNHVEIIDRIKPVAHGRIDQDFKRVRRIVGFGSVVFGAGIAVVHCPGRERDHCRAALIHVSGTRQLCADPSSADPSNAIIGGFVDELCLIFERIVGNAHSNGLDSCTGLRGASASPTEASPQ